MERTRLATGSMENYLGQMAIYVPYKQKTSSVIKNILTV